MLTISPVKSSKDASRYFEKDNYYSQDEGIQHSQWQGQGADVLGLSGQAVYPEQFKTFLEGAIDGIQLGRTTTDGIKHRPGWDLTFSAPKSVSILSEVYGLSDVRAAHEEAVKAGIAFVQKEAAITRLSVGGKVKRINTNNALFATFTHDVSRELDPQLHTHAIMINATHTAVGWRSLSTERLYKIVKHGGMAYRAALAVALTERGYLLKQHHDSQFFEIDGVPQPLISEFSERAKQIQAYFKDRAIPYDPKLAKQIALLTRKSKKSVDRDVLHKAWKDRVRGYHFNDEDARLLSQGGARLPGAGAPEKDAGLPNQDGGGAGLPGTGVPEKDTGLPNQGGGGAGLPGTGVPEKDAGLPNQGGGGAGLPGAGVPEKDARLPGTQPSKDDVQDLEYEKFVRRIVRKAIRHELERDMAAGELLIGETALRFGLGKIDYQAIRAEIQRLKDTHYLIAAEPFKEKFRPGKERDLWTTVRMKNIESTLIDFIERGRQVGAPLITEKAANKFLKKEGLTPQQLNAVLRASASKDRFFGIQGDPGVGKTRTLRSYRKLLTKKGYEVLAFAPSYQAVAELTESLGVEGMTVDRYLADPKSAKMGRALKKQVWFVDEGSMLSTDKMNALLSRAEKKNARVLLVGDHKQLEAVGPGRAFYQLQQAGLDLAVIDKRLRQKTEHMQTVVQKVLDKDYAGAIMQMHKNKDVIQSGNDKTDNQQKSIESLANEWLSRDQKRRDNTLIVSPLNEQRAAINKTIREGLKKEGSIGRLEYSTNVFDDRHLTEQEKRLVMSYQAGDVLRFSRDYKATGRSSDHIKRHEYFNVVGINNEKNLIAIKSRDDGRVVYVDPRKKGANYPGGLHVFKEVSIQISKGDKVRWTDNTNKQGLKRNTEAVVQGVGDGYVRLNTGGKSVKLNLHDLKNHHFTHDYAKTAYGVQGKTNKEVLALMHSTRLNTTNQRAFMVAITRAEEGVKVFTDSMSRLSQALNTRSGDNPSALTDQEFNRLANERMEEERNQTRHHALI